MSLTQRQFYYMRHGQTDWNVKKLCVGHVDVPLNDNGMEQARLAAPVVQRLSISTIFHSPLERARVTALVAGYGAALPIREDVGLREVCLGIKEGHPEGDASDDFVSAWLAGEKISDAESFNVFRNRVVSAINRCLSHESAKPPLIVAHSGVFMALASICEADIEDIEHCIPYHFEPSKRGWSVRRAI